MLGVEATASISWHSRNKKKELAKQSSSKMMNSMQRANLLNDEVDGQRY